MDTTIIYELFVFTLFGISLAASRSLCLRIFRHTYCL